MNEKKTKGITLISLVVTIIVIIIIATISINLSIGDDGIITRSVNTKKQEELQIVRKEIEDGYRRLEYYERSSADVGTTVSTLLSMEKLSKYVTGRVHFVTSDLLNAERAKFIYTNDNGTYTGIIDKDGELTVYEGIYIDDLDNGVEIGLDGVTKLTAFKEGYTFISVNEGDIEFDADGNITSMNQDEADVELRDTEGNLVVRFKVTKKSKNNLYATSGGEYTVQLQSGETLDNYIDTTQGIYKVIINGEPKLMKFIDVVYLEDNCYAGYFKKTKTEYDLYYNDETGDLTEEANEYEVYTVIVFTYGPGNGVIFGNTSDNSEHHEYLRQRKRIEFNNENVYEEISSVIIDDTITYVPYACLDNFGDVVGVVKNVDGSTTVIERKTIDYLYVGTNVKKWYPMYIDKRTLGKEDTFLEKKAVQEVFFNAKSCNAQKVSVMDDEYIFGWQEQTAIAVYNDTEVNIGIKSYDKKEGFFSNAERIIIGNEVEYIFYQFAAEGYLYSLTIPKNVKLIGDSSFSDCLYLKDLTFDNDFRGVIGNYAFSGDIALRTLNLPGSKVPGNDLEKSNGNMGFSFSNCTGLTEVNMQEGFEYIHVGMFNGCSNIIKVSIPNSIKKIDAAIDTGSFIYGKTFGGARKVRELYWNIDGYSSEGYSSEYNVGYMFDLVSTGSAMGMDYYWQEVNSEYRPYRYCMDAINDGKTSITRIITYDEHEIEYDSSTVAASYSFEKIILGPNVRYIPTSAFKQCTFLREITIPDSVGGIGRASFAYAYCLEKINTNKVIYLGDYAFYNSGIRELVLNSKVEAIGAECFGETDLLKKVFWNPNASCKYTHENFARNEGGNYIKYPYLLYSSIKNESGGYSYTGTIEELTFGTDCTEIPLFAFAFQDKIKSLIIPDNIEYIKDKAFFYCSGIEHLDLGNGVQRLGAFAFRYCTKLKEITLPNSIKYMESMVFRNTGIETINYNIKNGYIWMDNGYISTEDYPPLTYCPATTVNIAPDVTKLGNYAFGGMLKLQSITIPTSIPKSSLKSNMFWSCTSLTEILYNGVNILGTF